MGLSQSYPQTLYSRPQTRTPHWQLQSLRIKERKMKKQRHVWRGDKKHTLCKKVNYVLDSRTLKEVFSSACSSSHIASASPPQIAIRNYTLHRGTEKMLAEKQSEKGIGLHKKNYINIYNMYSAAAFVQNSTQADNINSEVYLSLMFFFQITFWKDHECD